MDRALSFPAPPGAFRENAASLPHAKDPPAEKRDTPQVTVKPAADRPRLSSGVRQGDPCHQGFMAVLVVAVGIVSPFAQKDVRRGPLPVGSSPERPEALRTLLVRRLSGWETEPRDISTLGLGRIVEGRGGQEVPDVNIGEGALMT